jgi:hypothetical protein
MRNRGAREIHRKSGAVDDHFHDVRIRELAGRGDPVVQRGHLQRSVGQERRHRFANRIGIDQWLVALHVDDDVAVERRGDFGQTIRRAVMIGARHPHLAAELLHGPRNPHVVGRDDDLRNRRRSGGAPVDVLDHRAAVYQRERLAGESAGGESRGDEGDSAKGRDRFQSMITSAISRSGLHGES